MSAISLLRRSRYGTREPAKVCNSARTGELGGETAGLVGECGRTRPILTNFFRSVFRSAEVDFWNDSRRPVVTLRDLAREGLGIFFADQIDGAASETAPGHSSSDKAR